MSQTVDNIKQALTKISNGEGMMEMLMEFSRTLDGINIFAYKNWIDGELVRGPNINRYWFITEWMYPQSRMPDPDGALRLEKIGCKVSYKKDVFNKPVKVFEPSDWEDPTTKQAKIENIPVYLVKIVMPKKYIVDQLESFMDELDNEVEEETTELAQEYESDIPEEEEEMPLEDDDMGMEAEEEI